MSAANERATDRELIREEVVCIDTGMARASEDPLAPHWALARLAAQGVLAILNLAETIDAGDRLTDRHGLLERNDDR